MKCNYHTHTWRCFHATGKEEEYVENAIAGGIKVLGFSDHTPMPYSGGYVSLAKMGLDKLEGYVDTVLRLRRQYRGEIEILLGLEVEYYPAYFDKLLEILKEYPMEYFLLGQHYLGNEVGEVFCGKPTKDEVSLQRYVEQCIEALKTGRFTYLAHPDLLNFKGSKEVYQHWYGKLCREAKRLGVPLEINFLGIWDERHYPNPWFWELAGEVGNQVVFGSDAHAPGKVYNPKAEAIANQMVEMYELDLLESVPLVDPLKEM